MNGLWRRIVNLLVVLTLAIGAIAVVPGCREEGPGEEAGEAVDEAAEEAGEAVEEAGEAVQGSAK
jgi:hypothetical protein